MPREVKDPVVEVLQFAAEMWARYELNPIYSILAAAYSIYGPRRGYIPIAAEAAAYYQTNKTWKLAMKVAEFDRKEELTFGTLFV